MTKSRITKMWIRITVGLGAILSSMTCASANPDAVVRYFREISGKKIVSSIHNREPNSRPDMQFERLHAVVGKYPGMWSGDFLFKSDDVNSRWAMIYEAEKQWKEGAIVQVMLHVVSPLQSEPGEWKGGVLSKLTDEEWKDLTTDGGKLNEVWKRRLDDYAIYLDHLKRHGVTVLFRPFHEMNQGLFWWGGRPGPEGTAKLYELTHDYLTDVKGLDNLVWVWNMQDIHRNPEEPLNLGAYRPRDDVWDIFSFDVYENGFDQDWYEHVVEVAGDKPMGIGECSRLPSPDQLEKQPRWCFFMSWAELTFSANTPEEIRELYALPQIVTRDELPVFHKPQPSIGSL